MLKAFLAWWRERVAAATVAGVQDAVERIEQGGEGDRLRKLLAGLAGGEDAPEPAAEKAAKKGGR